MNVIWINSHIFIFFFFYPLNQKTVGKICSDQTWHHCVSETKCFSFGLGWTLHYLKTQHWTLKFSLIVPCWNQNISLLKTLQKYSFIIRKKKKLFFSVRSNLHSTPALKLLLSTPKMQYFAQQLNIFWVWDCVETGAAEPWCSPGLLTIAAVWISLAYLSCSWEQCWVLKEDSD